MKIKNYLRCLTLTLGCSFLLASPAAHADDPWVRYYLQLIYGKATEIAGRTTEILGETKNILAYVSTLPVYIKDITQMAVSWNKTAKDDEANIIANNQTDFGLLAANYNRQISEQLQKTGALTAAYLKAGSFDSRSLPDNANALNYPILTGMPIEPLTDKKAQEQFQLKAKQYAADYLNYSVAGTFVLSTPPRMEEGKGTENEKKYMALYNTLSAVKSYNFFLLSGLNQITENDAIAKRLTTQASDANWFVQVGAQPLGLVLRELLMYTSQNYVQMSQMLKIQRQQLAAQAMTNTLLSIQTQETVGALLKQQVASEQQPKQQPDI